MSKKNDAYAQRLSERQIYGNFSLQPMAYLLDLVLGSQETVRCQSSICRLAM